MLCDNPIVKVSVPSVTVSLVSEIRKHCLGSPDVKVKLDCRGP